MNVLILTPDAVGSTLLQRLITIYMQFHEFDRPVINLHELSNGLKKYYNNNFNQEVLGRATKPGYYQSLDEITDLLKSVDHYKTSRLAQYHIKNRQDTIEQQVPFYHYLNDNFFIIACRRHNVFEHAISWCLSKITKKLNVYTPDEKINSFYNLYRDRLEIDPNSLFQTLQAYKIYINWCDNHFSVASYFYYDEHLPDIEKYILNLPIFAGQSQRVSWKNKYDIEFNDWNRSHYLSSDIGSLALNHADEFKQLATSAVDTKISLTDQNFLTNFIQSYYQIADPSWPRINSLEDYNNLPDVIKRECHDIHGLTPGSEQYSITTSKNINLILPEEHNKFLEKNSKNYARANTSISDMVDQGVMISPPPIKKQTMAEKAFLIKNFDQCLAVYNKWILNNPEIGNPIDIDVIKQFSQIEQKYWSPVATISDQLGID